ncbi:MAG: Mur ligase family protein, partial [Ginsengibacter sp.]
MNVVISYTIEQIVKYTGGKLVKYNPEISSPTYLSLDSRKILFPESTIFIALHTAQRDGSEFVETLYQKGVRNFLITDTNIELNKIRDANVIIVNDTLRALQSLAANHRINHNLLPGEKKLPVIGITGSNGKTVVKEWLVQLLENNFTIVRSPGSYNSQIGVPLSVLNLNSSHTLGIFEAGISTSGEMTLLEKIIRPTIGVFTNIGQAHNEGFKSTLQKIHEKLTLFIHADNLIFSGDDEMLKKEILRFKQRIKTNKNGLNLFSWGKLPGNNLQICSIKKNKNSTGIEGIYKGKNYFITIPFGDDASIENAVSCWCVLILLDKNIAKVTKKFGSLYPVAMRLELKQGINQCTIINDSYSNDLHSLSIAVNFLSQQKQHAQHSIILSDILQSGRKPNELYAEVAALLHHKQITRFVGIGPEIFSHQKEFSFLKSTYFFLTVEDFLKNISPLHFHNENILV